MIISSVLLGIYCVNNGEKCVKTIMDNILVTTILIAVVIVCITYLYPKIRSGKRKSASFYPLTLASTRKIISEKYTYFKDQRLKGDCFSLWGKSFYVPSDIDLLKDIMIKHFDSFVNHTAYVNEEADPVGVILFALKDDKWRNLRAKLSPTFTSGRIKMMFQTMLSCTELLVDTLKQECALKKPINVKDVLSRFTTDIIGSVVFGIECNSLKYPECEFRKYGNKVNKFTWRKALSLTIPYCILKRLNFRATDKDVEQFFIGLVKEIADYRESNNIYRKDFMHLMLQLKNRGKTFNDEKVMDNNVKGEHISIPEITAHCVSFFVGGFDTTSILMTFTLLEIAKKPDIQEKLRDEIKNTIEKHDGITYDGIMQMSYLDQVVCETLRLHSPIFATNRVCTERFVVPGTDQVIEKDQELLIPIYPIHHDPEYYPDPENFDPDRFSVENKTSIPQYAFIPFAEGPRMCIGSRYALLQSKVGLICVLNNFKVILNSKTILPVTYNSNALLLTVKGDVWLDFQPLKQ